MATKEEELQLQDVFTKLDKYLAESSQANMNKKANELGQSLKDFLKSNPEGINNYQEIGPLIESLGTHWVATSNPRVCQYGLEALIIIASALQSRYKNYCHTVYAHVVGKMICSNEIVREKIRTYFVKCVEIGAYSPTSIVEKMFVLLPDKHRDKSAEAQKVILEVLIMSYRGDKKISPQLLKDLVKKEVSLLTSHFREDAEKALQELSDQLGLGCVINILEKEQANYTNTNHQKRIQALIEEYRELHADQLQSGVPAGQDDDEPDFAIPVTKAKRPAPSVKPKPKTLAAPPGVTAPKPNTMARSGSVRSKIGEGDKYVLRSGPAGEADEAWFVSAFEDVPDMTIVNPREFHNFAKKVLDELKGDNEMWEHKILALKKLRGLIGKVDGMEEEKVELIRNVSQSLVNTLKEIRTQVARESALTFAYICVHMKNKVDLHTCEVILAQILTNVQNTAVKVISSSANITLQYMLMHVSHGRLISSLVSALQSSKSREVRITVCESLALILQRWPEHKLEQQIPNLQEGIKRGMSDSSDKSRAASRRAFCAFREHFPEQGEALLKSLDTMSQKHLMAGGDSSSTSSSVTRIRPTTTTRTGSSRPAVVRQGSFNIVVGPGTVGSSEDLSRDGGGEASGGGAQTPTTPRRASASSAIPVLKRYQAETPRRDMRNLTSTPAPSVRSNSAIDLQAVQRAKVRQQYAALARQKVGSGASLPRPAKKMDTVSGTMSGQFGTERTGRTRNRVAGVSQSQPSSRSGSPSSRLGYHTYHLPENSLAYQSRRVPPRSQGTSRETSPNRFGSKRSMENLFQNKRRVGDRPPIQPTGRPVMAQKMLAQSLEAEQSEMPLYDTEPDSLGHKVSPRKTSYRPFEDHSDDSDASSLCSERSFDSYRRPSDSFSWSGSQQRLYRDVWETGVKNIVEIIEKCESTHWGDRKEGLVALQEWLKSGNTLSSSELKRVTDIFTRMFMDSHTKVFSLFLDTLNELVMVHRSDLNSWLYILLTRLLNKLGSDLLSSIQNKILKSLDVIRDSFPPELQMSTVLRFLIDPMQTPNLRVKTAALNFVTRLCPMTDPAQAFPAPTPSPSSHRFADREKDPTTLALQRMIGWTMGESIKQGNELRRAAQEAIIALFNLNTPQVTLRLANLPQEYQEAAATLLRGRVRRSSTSGGGSGSPTSPLPSREYPRLASPGPQHLSQHRSSDSDSHSINPEEIYRSLRKTTAEIQNYTYEAGTEKPPDKDNTTSKDSGISQLSGTEALEEAMEELSIQSSSSSNATSSTMTNRVLTVRDCNGMDTTDNTQQEDGLDEQEAMRKIVEALRSPPDSDNGENISIIPEIEKRASLSHLTRLIRDSSVSILQENFKALLRILFSNLSADTVTRDVQTRVLVLAALTELVKKRAMTESLNHYVELLILKVLNSYKDGSKEVVRSAESCANTIATTLSPSLVIKVLRPLIQTGEYPLNLAAVKMLTRLVDAWGRDPVYSFLPDLMPGLIQAYDNQESSVRKSAVFCMVSLHAAIGEEDLKPHLVALNGSKLKLLHLYIRRSQQGSSAPTSPRNHPPSSS